MFLGQNSLFVLTQAILHSTLIISLPNEFHDSLDLLIAFSRKKMDISLTTFFELPLLSPKITVAVIIFGVIMKTTDDSMDGHQE